MRGVERLSGLSAKRQGNPSSLRGSCLPSGAAVLADRPALHFLTDAMQQTPATWMFRFVARSMCSAGGIYC